MSVKTAEGEKWEKDALAGGGDVAAEKGEVCRRGNGEETSSGGNKRDNDAIGGGGDVPGENDEGGYSGYGGETSGRRKKWTMEIYEDMECQCKLLTGWRKSYSCRSKCVH